MLNNTRRIKTLRTMPLTALLMALLMALLPVLLPVLPMAFTASARAQSPASAEAPAASAWKFFQDGPHRLAYQCLGSGSPTVILEPPGGLPAEVVYRKLLPGLAQSHKTCFYERLGFGRSDMAPAGLTQTIVQHRAQLQALIEREAAGEKILLAGFSLGAQSARVYAAAHPERVAGLLLIDPIHEDWADELKQRMHADDWAKMQGIFDWLKNRAAYLFAESQADVRAATLPQNMPVRVISRGMPFYRVGLIGMSDDGVKLFNGVHDRLQLDLLKLTARTTRVVATRSDHTVADSEPELVLAEFALLLKDLLAAASDGAVPSDSLAAHRSHTNRAAETRSTPTARTPPARQ